MDMMSQFEQLNRPDPDKLRKPWMADVELILATPDMLGQIADECIAAKAYGLDLEATGLDTRAFPNDSGVLETVDKIVGYCVAPSRNKGYYIPVRHRGKGAVSNVPPRLAAAMVKKIQDAGTVAVFHNAKYDIKLLKYEPAGGTGDWDDPHSWDDTILLAYLWNSRAKSRRLKMLSETLLNREQIELTDLFLKERGKKVNIDFASLEPLWKPTVWYGAADATNTLALWEFFLPLVMEKDKFGNGQKTIYTIEKLCLLSNIWMEQCRIFIDRPKLIELIQLGQKEWWESINEVYDAVGEALGRNIRPDWVPVMDKMFDPMVMVPEYMEVREMAKRDSKRDTRPFLSKSVPGLKDPKVRETVDFPPSYDVTIPAELGMMMREIGVKGLEPTEKSGQVKTAKDVLERIIKEAGAQFAFMNKVKRFREIAKALGNNLFTIYRDTTPERSPDGCVWANFKATAADTGRFSTPTPRKGAFHGQVNWNVQSTKAPYYDPKDPPPECVYRQRECVAARPGYVLHAIDFSGVELRIVTNLSGEQKWVKAFFECSTCGMEFERGILPPPFCPSCGSDKIGDLHSITALSLFSGADPKGDPKAFKALRQIAKIVNFLLCYGGSGFAVMTSIKCDEEEGWRLKNKFDKTYRGLLRWWKVMQNLAKKQKYVTTVYGRKYPIPDVDHEVKYFRGKAMRNAVNGPVQGSSADIMKLAMGLLYRKFKELGWINRGPGLPDLILMTITIHDELVFEIHESICGEAVGAIDQVMCVDSIAPLGWLIGLKVDIEFGANWMVPNNLTEMAFNQGGGTWTTRLARIYPSQYANFLSCGGSPIDVDAPPPDVPQAHPSLEVPGHVDLPLPSAAQPQAPATYATNSVGTPPPAPVQASPAPAKAAPPKPPEREGQAYVYKLSRLQMAPEHAEKLARVISRCSGRGVDVLYVRDDQGNDLLPSPAKVAYDEFRVIAQYEGL